MDTMTDSTASSSPPGRSRRWPRRVVLGIAVVVLTVGIAGARIRTPYSIIAPGQAVPLAPRVHVSGAPGYPEAKDDIRLLFVTESTNVNLWQYLRAKLNPDDDLLKTQALTGGEPSDDEAADAVADMADAKIAATKVALQAAGYKIPAPDGLVVEAVYPEFPAAKTLQAGDLLISVDGKNILDGNALQDEVRKHKPGQTVDLTLIRNGKKITTTSGVAIRNKTTVMGVRVAIHWRFPVNVTVDTSDIGGPSAGLAMTLAILDRLTPGALTGNQRIAVTGTIDNAGNVGEIGGIEQKAVAVREAHVSLFLVPRCVPKTSPDLAGCRADLSKAVQRVGKSVKVIPVANLKEALAALRTAGGAPVVPVTVAG